MVNSLLDKFWFILCSYRRQDLIRLSIGHLSIVVILTVLKILAAIVLCLIGDFVFTVILRNLYAKILGELRWRHDGLLLSVGLLMLLRLLMELMMVVLIVKCCEPSTRLRQSVIHIQII